MLQTRLVDVSIEALAQYLIQQVGNLIAAISALLRHPLQVEFGIEVRLLALKILQQVFSHETQLTHRQSESTDRRALTAGNFADGLFTHQRGIFVDPPDQSVTNGNRLAGPE